MHFLVIPAKAGIQFCLGWVQVGLRTLDSGFHRSDDLLWYHQWTVILCLNSNTKQKEQNY